MKYRIAFTASAELKGKLERVQELIFGGSGDRTIENTLELVLEHYLKNCDPRERRESLQEKRKKRAERMKGEDSELAALAAVLKAAKRVAPADIRDEVMERDGYCCSYVAEDGTRCGSRVNLEIDHCVPWARGGMTEESNLRLLCKTHNLMFARKEFGEAYIEQRVKDAGRSHSKWDG